MAKVDYDLSDDDESTQRKGGKKPAVTASGKGSQKSSGLYTSTGGGRGGGGGASEYDFDYGGSSPAPSKATKAKPTASKAIDFDLDDRDESEESEDTKKRQQKIKAALQSKQSTNALTKSEETRKPVSSKVESTAQKGSTTTSSSTSALDKAKSFLSKYSKKPSITEQPKFSRPKDALSDDDLSLGSSTEKRKQKKPDNKKATKKASRGDDEDSFENFMANDSDGSQKSKASKRSSSSKKSRRSTSSKASKGSKKSAMAPVSAITTTTTTTFDSDRSKLPVASAPPSTTLGGAKPLTLTMKSVDSTFHTVPAALEQPPPPYEDDDVDDSQSSEPSPLKNEVRAVPALHLQTTASTVDDLRLNSDAVYCPVEEDDEKEPDYSPVKSEDAREEDENEEQTEEKGEKKSVGSAQELTHAAMPSLLERGLTAEFSGLSSRFQTLQNLLDVDSLAPALPISKQSTPDAEERAGEEGEEASYEQEDFDEEPRGVAQSAKAISQLSDPSELLRNFTPKPVEVYRANTNTESVRPLPVTEVLARPAEPPTEHKQSMSFVRENKEEKTLLGAVAVTRKDLTEAHASDPLLQKYMSRPVVENAPNPAWVEVDKNLSAPAKLPTSAQGNTSYNTSTETSHTLAEGARTERILFAKRRDDDERTELPHPPPAMKSTGTQFTGNHVSVQADLLPDGLLGASQGYAKHSFVRGGRFPMEFGGLSSSCIDYSGLRPTIYSDTSYPSSYSAFPNPGYPAQMHPFYDPMRVPYRSPYGGPSAPPSRDYFAPAYDHSPFPAGFGGSSRPNAEPMLDSRDNVSENGDLRSPPEVAEQFPEAFGYGPQETPPFPVPHRYVPHSRRARTGAPTSAYMAQAAGNSAYLRQLGVIRAQLQQQRTQLELLTRSLRPAAYVTLSDTREHIQQQRQSRSNLQLWEAFMMVDPTLSEEDAKKLAQQRQALSSNKKSSGSAVQMPSNSVEAQKDCATET